MKDDEIQAGSAEFPGEERKSRTRIKQEMIELQKLGEGLVNLPRSFLKKIGLPPELLEAVLYAKEVRTHGARRRQKQRIGALMRELEDPSFIRTALDHYYQGITGRPEKTPADTAESGNGLDGCAGELASAGDDVIDALASGYPSMDRSRLIRLIRHVREAASPSARTKAVKALASYLAKFKNLTA